MENKLDKLFRDKLEQHSIEPSSHAWEKVAGTRPLTSKGETSNANIVFGLRIAAAVALFAAIGWFAYDFGKDDTVEITKDSSVKQPEANQSKQEVAIKDESLEETKDVENKKPETIQQTTAKTIVSIVVATHSPVAENKKEKLIEEIQPDNHVASVEEVTEPVTIQQPTVKPATAKSMVIVYNLAPVETQQEVEPAKANRLKKVLEFAKDVKSGDATTFASVRNWKDNLLGSEELVRVEKQNNE